VIQYLIRDMPEMINHEDTTHLNNNCAPCPTCYRAI